MRLNYTTLLDAITHDDVHVRNAVVEHLTAFAQDDVEVTRRLITRIVDQGLDSSTDELTALKNCRLDNDNFLWVLEQLRARQNNPLVPTILMSVVADAPLELIEQNSSLLEELFFKAAGTTRADEYIDRVINRRDANHISADESWATLESICEDAAAHDQFPSEEVRLASVMIERISRCGAEFETKVLEGLDHVEIPQKGPLPWRIGFMVQLAGMMKLEKATPAILRCFNIDWDWYYEICQNALSQIGSASTIDAVSEFYPTGDWSTRLFLTTVFENVYLPNSVDAVLEQLKTEKDCFLRGQLGIALANQFDERGYEKSKEIYYENPDDPECRGIIERLYAHACLAKIDEPELDAWRTILDAGLLRMQSFLAGNWDRSDSPSSSVNAPNHSQGLLSSTPESLGIATRKPSPSNLSVAQRATRSTAVACDTRVGRNEMCPCGSGKKFKKCCLRA